MKANRGKKRQSDEAPNVVKDKKKKLSKEPKKETAEDRANKELEKIAAFQARLAKKKNKQKKLRTVVDDKFMTNKRGIFHDKLFVLVLII